MRYVIVHSKSDRLFEGPSFAHVFGPFDSGEEAQAFEEGSPDTCFKVMLPVVGPAIEDVLATATDETPVQ